MPYLEGFEGSWRVLRSRLGSGESGSKNSKKGVQKNRNFVEKHEKPKNTKKPVFGGSEK